MIGGARVRKVKNSSRQAAGKNHGHITREMERNRDGPRCHQRRFFCFLEKENSINVRMLTSILQFQYSIAACIRKVHGWGIFRLRQSSSVFLPGPAVLELLTNVRRFYVRLQSVQVIWRQNVFVPMAH